MPKILNISHCDCDGLGAYMVLKEVFGRENVDVFFTNYPFTDKQITSIEKYQARMLGMGQEYSAVFVTDLSFKKDDRDFLVKLKGIFPINMTFVLVDHHDSTDENLSDLFTDFYLDKSNNYAGCGLTFNLFKDRITATPEKMKQIAHFNKVADSYDLWKLDAYWEEGQTLTDLVELFSPYDVKDWTYEILSNPKSDFILKQLVESLEGKKKFALKQAEENKFERKVTVDGKELKVALFFSNSFRNFLCHNLDADVALCANPASLSISFRSKTLAVKVNRFCARYKGGGHELAGACRLPKDLFFQPEKVLDEFVEFIFSEENN